MQEAIDAMHGRDRIHTMAVYSLTLQLAVFSRKGVQRSLDHGRADDRDNRAAEAVQRRLMWRLKPQEVLRGAAERARITARTAPWPCAIRPSG
jgi:hypothetical protein